MPTQSTIDEVAAAASGKAVTDKDLKRITFDARCAYDDLKEAAKAGTPDEQGDLLFAARTRLESALSALRQMANG
jgi:hypothetical protein